ncbi:MAG: amino acid ABC transporter substrate-binding protein [Rhodospirillales bacterium]|nr:amino acid ABC transporter substrate-binding protein [Rhodospirillales bacterium]
MSGVLFFSWLEISGAASASDSVVFACNEFPPYKMENSDSGLPGFDVEFLEEVFKRAGISVQIEYMPWERALYEARYGRVDGVCSCSSTLEREKYLYFSDPLGKASSGLFSLSEKGFTNLTRVEDIGDKKVGVIKGYNIVENLHAAKIKNIVELTNESQGLEMLFRGRIDFYYSYDAPTLFYLKNRNQSDMVTYHEISYGDYYSCLSKNLDGSEVLLKKFNTGLRQIKKDGTYDKILARYR